MDIYNFLKNHNGISFHMPAHKNRVDFIYTDLTEIYGADNLRSPNGIIENSQKKAAEFLDGDKAYYLVNGASSGIAAAVASLGEKEIYIDRNCHESVINGLIISGGIPKYIYPEKDEIFGIPKPVELKNACDNFVYTAVTYYGKVCNTKRIRETAGKNAVLVSDEAHGAHFYFSEGLKKYCAKASDISILSFHKSLPSLTQTAVMLTKGNNINTDFLEKLKNLITTTSPSYPLMASLDYAFSEGENLYKKSLSFINEIKEEIKESSDILIYDSDDPWKLLLNFKNCNSDAKTIDKRLSEKYNIYTEGVFGNNILFMLSPYNTENEIMLFKNTVINLSREKSEKEKITDAPIIKLKTAVTPREAFFAKGETVSIKNSVNRISKENVTLFPPCVPIITAGERITEEAAEHLLKSKKTIEVIK